MEEEAGGVGDRLRRVSWRGDQTRHRTYACSDDDEEEGETPEAEAEAEDDDENPKRSKKSKANSHELVEYSPDELEDVNKELLNAEITQLEGKSSARRRMCHAIDQRRGDRQSQAKPQRSHRIPET